MKKDFLKNRERAFQAMEDKDAAAKKRGGLVGRYLQEPHADGYAYYEIISETPRTVQVRVITGLGDDWRIPQWGDGGSISKKYAVGRLAQRDRMELIFKNRERDKDLIKGFLGSLRSRVVREIPGATGVQVDGDSGDDGVWLTIRYQDGVPRDKGRKVIEKILEEMPKAPKVSHLSVDRCFFTNWGREYLVSKAADAKNTAIERDIDIPREPAGRGPMLSACHKAVVAVFEKNGPLEPSDTNAHYRLRAVPWEDGYAIVVEWHGGPTQDQVAAAIAGVKEGFGSKIVRVILQRNRSWEEAAVEELSDRAQAQ